MVLVENNPIRVSGTQFEEPGLLATTKSIRKEAESIVYVENRFVVILPDFCSDVLMLRVHKNMAVRSRGMPICQSLVSCEGQRTCWPNLESWLYRTRARLIPA